MTFLADIAGAIVVPAHQTNVYDPANHGGVPNKPRGLVLHTPEEPADNKPYTPEFFADPNRSASTHYYAHSSGDLYQMVPEHFGAIANGLRNKPLPAWAVPGTSLNWQTLSIEIEGYAASIAQTLTAKQRATVVRWIVSCAKRHGIPLDRVHVIGHYQVADNRSDPGTLDIDGLVREARAFAAPEEEPMKARRIVRDAQTGHHFALSTVGWYLGPAGLAEAKSDPDWPDEVETVPHDELRRIPRVDKPRG